MSIYLLWLQHQLERETKSQALQQPTEFATTSIGTRDQSYNSSRNSQPELNNHRNSYLKRCNNRRSALQHSSEHEIKATTAVGTHTELNNYRNSCLKRCNNERRPDRKNRFAAIRQRTVSQNKATLEHLNASRRLVPNVLPALDSYSVQEQSLSKATTAVGSSHPDTQQPLELKNKRYTHRRNMSRGQSSPNRDTCRNWLSGSYNNKRRSRETAPICRSKVFLKAFYTAAVYYPGFYISRNARQKL